MTNFPVHKIFISYHHTNDQESKATLLEINRRLGIFIDMSVDTGDIDPNLSDESIRVKIRDEYLKDSTVTILLIGTETAGRKHIDWELYSSMIDGQVNKKSGLVVVQLPSTNPIYVQTVHGAVEKEQVYPEISDWISIDTRSEYERRHPFLPARIIDQLVAKDAKVSVTKWNSLGENLDKLALLIDCAYKSRSSCDYDLSRVLKKRDS